MVEAFDLAGLAAEQARLGRLYFEFLRVGSMSAGRYTLPAGSADPQQPHGEDELYLVIGGRATLRVGDDEVKVGPGSLCYVPARVPHRFAEIEEDLAVLVVFSPAEGTTV